MSGPRRRKPPERPSARKRRTPQRDFWGVETEDDDYIELVSAADDPTVMLRSLSSPPLPGRETVAVHYFAAVAQKAASLAIALAAASDLLDLDGDDDEPEFELA